MSQPIEPIEPPGRPPELPIIRIGEVLPYADGAEDQLIEIMQRVEDRSTASDELARFAADWPTRYHLSRQRANLLHPIRITESDRVLDVGAGTGALTRYIAERGATVVGLEGSRARARAAALRCAGMERVELLCGRVDDLDADELFDVVVCVGVLEYAASTLGGGGGPEAFLGSLRDHVAPGGVLVLAIENQIGVQYVIGYDEDHLGEPWAGIEGYGASPVRTWSRPQLGALLTDAGFVDQHWLFPYPDYKMPTAVLDAAAFELPDSVEFVDQLVGSPVNRGRGRPTILCDDRLAHRTFLQAGLGADMANAFLVVAGAADVDPTTRLPENTLAWRFTNDRLKSWAQVITVERRDEARIAERAWQYDSGDHETERQDSWLLQEATGEEEYRVGPNMEQLMLEAIRNRDAELASRRLHRWHDELAAARADVDAVAVSHPYLPVDVDQVLPGHFLDCGLGNFIPVGDELAFIDREWVARGGVSYVFATLRALWRFSETVVNSGAIHPWSAELTVDAMAMQLAKEVGLEVDMELLDQWRAAEVQLIGLTAGVDAAAYAEELGAVGRRTRVDGALSGVQPLAAVRRQLADLQHRHRLLAEEHQELSRRLTASVDQFGDSIEGLTQKVDEVEQLAVVRVMERARGVWRGMRGR